MFRNTRSRIGLAVLSAALRLMANHSAASAEDTDSPRVLNLPRTPFDYSTSLPRHFAEVAQQFDNTPDNNPITDHGATLGRVLFYDTRLSANGTTSCASCHRQDKAFAEPRKVSVGFRGETVARNSMSLINSRYYRSGRFFWDERAASLEEQVLMPIENEIEMGHTLEQLVPQLQSDPIYPPLFRNAFGTPQVTRERMGRSLAQFLRSIVSCRSRFDEGRQLVDRLDLPFPNFTEEENLGKTQFLGRGGCAECHLSRRNGTDDGAFQSAFFFVDRATVNGVDGDTDGGADGGKGAVTQTANELGAFKAPSLRNVTLTAPYMHDGRFQTIDRVIEHYNWSVRPHPNLDPRLESAAANGIALPEREKVALARFLETLTDAKLVQDERFSDPFAK